MINDAVPLSVAHDPASGLWTVTAPKDSLGPIAVADGRVLVRFDGRMTAFDARDGGMLWQSPHRIEGIEFRLGTRFTAAGRHIVVPNYNPGSYSTDPITLTCLRQADGGLAWIRDGAPLSGYHVDDRTLILWQANKDAPRHITGIDLADGQRLWRHEHQEFESVLLTGGRVIVTVGTNHRHHTRAYDSRTGRRLWSSAPNRYPARLHLLRDERHPEPVVLASDPGQAAVRWFDPATGSELGSLTTGCRPRWDEVGTAGEVASATWSPVRGRRVVHVRPLGEGRIRTFLSQRPGGIAEPLVVEVDGRLYTTVQLDRNYDDPAKVRGERIVSARLGGPGRYRWLTGLRWPAKVPRRKRRGFFVHLVPGGRLLYALLIYCDETWAVVAVRRGRVLWRQGSRGTPPVPLGDRVLLLDDCGEHDHLRLVDGGTGASTGGCTGPNG